MVYQLVIYDASTETIVPFDERNDTIFYISKTSPNLRNDILNQIGNYASEPEVGIFYKNKEWDEIFDLLNMNGLDCDQLFRRGEKDNLANRLLKTPIFDCDSKYSIEEIIYNFNQEFMNPLNKKVHIIHHKTMRKFLNNSFIKE